MRKLRSQFDDDESFCRGLEEEFHRVAGLSRRQDEINWRLKGYERQLAQLEGRHPEARGVHSLDGIRRSLETHVIQGPEFRWRTPKVVADTVLENHGSAAIFGFSFAREPEWDADDIAAYSLSPHRLDSFRILLVNWWLTPRAKFFWKGDEQVRGLYALVRCFYPLVDKIVCKYRNRGRLVFGSSYEGRVRPYLRDALGPLVVGFDFFLKKVHRVHGKKWPMPSIEERLAATVYTAMEYPLSAYLNNKLDGLARDLLDLDRRAPEILGSPFRVEGYKGLVCLARDVEHELKITGNAVRGHRKRGHIKAWQAKGFRSEIGLQPSEPIALVPQGDLVDEGLMEQVYEGVPSRVLDPERLRIEVQTGEEGEQVSGVWVESQPFKIRGDSFWIYDWDSVLAMHNHWDGKRYRIEKPGPKAKEAVPKS